MLWPLLRRVPYVQDDDFFGRLIDRVKDQEWISNHGQNADIRFVCGMSGKWKLLKELGQTFNPLDDCRSRRPVLFENIGKNVFDFGERGLGPANLHAR
jgi:hypothetical protein